MFFSWGSVEFVTSYHGIAYHKFKSWEMFAGTCSAPTLEEAHPSDEIRDTSPRK